MLAPRPSRVALLWVLIVFGLLIPAAARAQSLRESTSLRFVPDSASMYSTSLRTRETFERFVNSRAFAKLKSLPLVQMGIGHLRTQWDTNEDLDELRTMLEQPENKQLVEVLLDGLSHEVFVYGDERVGEWLGLLPQLSQKINLAQMQATQRGLEDEEAMGQAIVDVLEKNPELLRVPGSVIGLRLTDTQQAVAQLARLETLVNQFIEAERPDLKGRFRRQQIGDASFLTLNVDGTLVPWDEVLDDADLEDDAKAKLKAQLEKVTFIVGLGVRDGYLMLGLGETDAQLRALGQGSLLVDHPKMKPLAKYFDRQVTSIGYASEDLVREMMTANQQLDQMVEMLRTALPVVPLPGDIKDDLLKDAERFAADVKSLQPRPGAMSGVTYEVEGGYETVGYNWTEQRTLDGSQQLSVLENIGGDPIAFYATRHKPDPVADQFAHRWGTKIGQYADRIALAFLQEEQKELYENVKERILPPLGRMRTAHTEKIRPALADGQVAIVLDAPLSQPRWHSMMPSAEEPLPLPALACVTGVSNDDQLRAGAAAYFDAVQAMITAMNEIAPDKIPPIQLPKPQLEEHDHGTIYSYAVAPMIGLDPQIAPNAGLSGSRLVVSLVPSATRRLLEARTPELAEPLSGVRDRPLASAWQFHFHRFVQMLRPWVNYGLQIADQQGELDPMIPEHVTAVLDVLECMRTITSYSYFEDDALVSFTRSQFQDLPPER